MSGYCNINDDDTFEDLQTSGRCMSMVLGKLFKETEGMVVELPYQEKYPNDTYGKYLVWKSKYQIHISNITDEDEYLKNMDNGTLVYVNV